MEATKLEDKINQLGKNKIDEDNVFFYKRKHKEFIKNNKLVLKTQKRFISERHNIFIDEINKIALRSNHEQRMQSINSTETNAYEKRKNLVSK